MTADFQIVPAGDAALLVEFDERIDLAINARAITFADALTRSALQGIRDIVPTFRSVAIYFDPLRTNQDQLIARLQAIGAAALSQELASPAAAIRIPVIYGGECGPDLAAVARFAEMPETEVVERHVATTYRVFMIGFMPGFAYMGSVDPRIAAPRRTTPRLKVPAGSVAIAGAQTGIYPSETPGGWQIIGRTSVRPFDVARTDVSLFKAGDTVQFYAIDRS